MAVHMIRVVAAANSTDTPGMTLSEIRTAMDEWVANNSEWTEDPQSHDMNEDVLLRDGTEVYEGSYRFTLDDAKDNLLQKCEDKLTDKVDWFRLGYHSCSHDEADPSPCSWEEVRDWTSKNTESVPSSVPSFV